MSDSAQFPGSFIYPEDCDAVMSPVGTVEESSGPVHMHIGGIALTFEIIGKSRNRLNLSQPSAGFVVGESGNGGVKFIDDVGKFTVRMKIEMAWSPRRL